MITKQTAMEIALSYREIENAEALLVQITEALKLRGAPDIRDMFGRLQNGLQLGVPAGESKTRLYNVPWTLAKPIIEAHIAHHKTMITVLSEKARIEMGDAP